MNRLPTAYWLLLIGISGLMADETFIIPRSEWQARNPKMIEPMPNPVPYVVIHHSYQPAACHTTKECVEAMQWMQNFHMNDRGWNDIGYHFAAGSDGNAYEGRGWSAVGAHAPGYNNISVGICVIGDWRQELPPQEQLDTVHRLIEFGVSNGMIREDHKLLGHRQVRNTECPGDRLFNEIRTWDHFSKKPNKEVVGSLKKISGGVKDKRLFFFSTTLLSLMVAVVVMV